MLVGPRPGGTTSWAPWRSPSRPPARPDVVYLGADVPVSGWLSAAESTRAAIAVIGVVGASDLAPAIEVIASLRQTAPPPITVVGGASVNDLGDPAEVTRLPDSLDRAVEIVAELLARRA